jgi:hypothetical protein
VFGKDKKLEERLREHGRRATAVVLEAESGVGITVGNPALAAIRDRLQPVPCLNV